MPMQHTKKAKAAIHKRVNGRGARVICAMLKNLYTWAWAKQKRQHSDICNPATVCYAVVVGALFMRTRAG